MQHPPQAAITLVGPVPRHMIAFGNLSRTWGALIGCAERKASALQALGDELGRERDGRVARGIRRGWSGLLVTSWRRLEKGSKAE
jgi:hypothetical protein